VARDLAEQGIRVVTIAPGIFETPLLGHAPRLGAGLAGQFRLPFPSASASRTGTAALAEQIITAT